MKKNYDFFEKLSFCLHSKCPECGKGKLFNPIYKIEHLREFFFPVKDCSFCGFHFEREAGYYFGCVFPILPVLAIFPAVIFAAVSYFALKMEPGEVAIAAVCGAMFGFLFFIRLAIAIYIAVDHAVCPPHEV